MIEVPSAWESQCVAEKRRLCESIAASIAGLATIGSNAEDAAQLLSLAVVAACRHWAVSNDDKPPSAFLNCAIRRKKLKIWRSIKSVSEFTVLSDNDELLSKPDLKASTDPVIESERNLHAKSVLALLMHTLTPSEFALLQWRNGGWTNSEIAQMTGNFAEGEELHGKVRREYWRVKKKAADFLKSCGIDSVEAALDATPEVRDAAWKRSIKRKAKQAKGRS